MKLMPFTAAVHKQLIEAGYTHLVKRYASPGSNYTEDPEIITLEAVRNQSVTGGNICLKTGDIKTLLNSKSKQYYVMVSQNVSSAV